jgi:hypothetical protein
VLPPTNRPASLKEQLMQMSWAGELDGWLTASPSWHLVADTATAQEWEPALRTALDQPLHTNPPLTAPELAALTARRAAHADIAANLLPAEYSIRYQQQFVDRLWMRSLGAVVGLYVLGVAIYLVALGYLSYQTQSVEQRVTELGPIYTNALQLKAQYQVLKDREELKYAALDCWNVTARLLPDGAALDSLDFSEGSRLRLNGTAPAGAVQSLLEFEAAMRKATKDGQPIFDPLGGENLSYRSTPGAAPGAGNIAWNFSLVLKRTEAQ